MFILFGNHKNLSNFVFIYLQLQNKNDTRVKSGKCCYVEQVLSNSINFGKQRLQVINDFDRTISLVSFEGKDCPTSNGVLESSQFVTAELRDKVYIFIKNRPQ